jgi:sensor histidine kinase YesM
VLLVGIVSIAFRGALYALLRRDELIVATLSIALVSVGVAALVETHRRLAAIIAAREQELASERRATVEAQLRALQAQIRPHFLFNTFNALSELIHQDADAAEDLVLDLAHLLRYSLRSSEQGGVPLADELEATRRYLRIEQARLGERLRVQIEEPPDLHSEIVPALVLQPLVENAVQHAVATRSEGGTVHIGGHRTSKGRPQCTDRRDRFGCFCRWRTGDFARARPGQLYGRWPECLRQRPGGRGRLSVR